MVVVEGLRNEVASMIIPFAHVLASVIRRMPWHVVLVRVVRRPPFLDPVNHVCVVGVSVQPLGGVLVPGGALVVA